MSGLSVLMALLSALANAAASVLQRVALMQQGGDPHGARQVTHRLVLLLSRPIWLGGAAALIASAAFQAGALATGRLSVVQPLLASELLFTLFLGSVVFRHRPDRRTRLSFLALGVGLALFLGAATPTAGGATADPTRWPPTGSLGAFVVAALVVGARVLSGAARAAVLGCATAMCFSYTAALVKEVTGRVPNGLGAVFTSWQLYGVCVVGALSLLLLQGTLRAGTLAASQPALTLGDALVSVALGWVLFGERIALGFHVLPEALGVALVAAGSLGLSHSPAVAGGWDAAAPRKGAPRSAAAPAQNPGGAGRQGAVATGVDGAARPAGRQGPAPRDATHPRPSEADGPGAPPHPAGTGQDGPDGRGRPGTPSESRETAGPGAGGGGSCGRDGSDRERATGPPADGPSARTPRPPTGSAHGSPGGTAAGAPRRPSADSLHALPPGPPDATPDAGGRQPTDRAAESSGGDPPDATPDAGRRRPTDRARRRPTRRSRSTGENGGSP